MTDPTPQTTPTRDEAVRELELIRRLVIPMVRERSREPGDAWDQAERVLSALASAPAPASGMDAVLNLYREAVRIDVKMEGPQFMGANSSALKRAWEADRASLSPAATPVSEAGGEAAKEAWRKWNDTYDPSKDMMLEGAAQRGFLEGWAAANSFRDNGERK